LEVMGGTIKLQSTLGQGTTVTVTIPYENDSAD
jgi:signal transduction histidine kinase